jgi:hypothetical protein
MKKLLLLSAVFLIISCDSMKNKTSNTEKSEGKETIEVTTTRKGDTVSYVVPVIKYKDTTIYTTNRQGTTLRTVYDQNGQISNIDCFASVIAEIRKENREFQNKMKQTTKDKKVETNFDWVIYIVIGAVVVVCFALFLAFTGLKSQKRLIP